MLKKFLREVISIVVGKQAEDIADLLYNKTHVNEFLIAKKLDLTINQTRNILYKISDYGLVSFIRKKDKKKGWYTYFWKIEVLKSLEFLKGILVKKINQVSYQIKSRETKEFYSCERCNIEVSQENALLYNFTCNECGEIFTLKDNTKVLRELKRGLAGLQRELNLVNEEIEKENEKIEKQKARELKKKQKEKKAARKKTAKKSAKKKTATRKKAKPVKKTAKKATKKKVGKKKGAKSKKVSKKSVKKSKTRKVVKKKLKKTPKKTARKKTKKKVSIRRR